MNYRKYVTVLDLKTGTISILLFIGIFAAVPAFIQTTKAIGTHVYQAPCEGTDVENNRGECFPEHFLILIR